MFRACALITMIAVPCIADVQITTTYTTDGQNADITISSNGNRMRYDYGNGIVMLRYCDQQKMVQIDEKAKTFLTVAAPDAKATSDSKPEITDTGERKEMFGHQARHLKITETAAGKKERTETDGWYIDLSGLGACFAREAGASDRGYQIADQQGSRVAAY